LPSCGFQFRHLHSSHSTILRRDTTSNTSTSRTALWIFYGETLSGTEVPLGLDLAGYSGLQLDFAGISTTEALLAIITVWPHDNLVPHSLELVLAPEVDPISVDFPFSSFSDGGLTQTDLSDIDYIFIQVQDGVSASWGITAFQAVN
jgi:hypothetical protein